MLGSACAPAVLNLGGIAKLTYLPAGKRPEAVITFDVGPANMVIDGVVERITAGRDPGGRYGKDRPGRARSSAGLTHRGGGAPLNRSSKRFARHAGAGRGALFLIAAAMLLGTPSGGLMAQAPDVADIRLALLPFAVSGALEYEGVGPLVPEMLASRMTDMGPFRFMDTVAMRKEGAAKSGALSPDDAARLANRFDADFVIAGAIRRSGGVTVLSAQPYARDGSAAGERVVVPVITVEDVLSKMEPLAEGLSARLRPSPDEAKPPNP
ncbi:MAG: anhydro-N-acetylmuramic acid kinase [Deltaproteobacteria bacterium]|nr:anhydro-N-acetylmuramic acid kinase [Deltaproteobacteria bacterium]